MCEGEAHLVMSDDTEQRVVAIEEIEQGRTEGYVPVTPLGPPPQGEPLLATQGGALAAPATPSGQSQPQGQPSSETSKQQAG